MKNSTKLSAPKFSFGTSNRAHGPKKYVTNELLNYDCIGKEAKKGPNYNVEDRFSYEKSPEWKIGTTERNTLDTKAKYEHYFRKDMDVNYNEFS